MSIAAAELLWSLVGIYFGIGALVALALLLGRGIARVDPEAAAAPLRVKLLLAPGLAALWPLMALKALGARR